MKAQATPKPGAWQSQAPRGPLEPAASRDRRGTQRWTQASVFALEVAGPLSLNQCRVYLEAGLTWLSHSDRWELGCPCARSASEGEAGRAVARALLRQHKARLLQGIPAPLAAVTLAGRCPAETAC